MNYLYQKLKDYSKSDYYPFHMPGHKRNINITGADLPYDIDITEIEGFDDLHHASGILLDAQKRAADLYHAEESHYLINGSTVGLLSAVLGCTKKGGKILIARNCHKSVYNAVILNELQPVYVYPEKIKNEELNGEIKKDDIKKILMDNPDIQAVVVTSPTYDGVVSDIKGIASIVHAENIPLILDEAHGAHFGLCPYFPQNGNENGADVVIHSLHKTLPALTQTALLHINGNIVDRNRIRRYLHMLQSSSPSYVLMSGIDECIKILNEKRNILYEKFIEILVKTREEMKNLRHLKLLESTHYDRSKILISTRHSYYKNKENLIKYTGKQLYNDLYQKYFLQMEMAAPFYILALTSLCDTGSGMRRLVDAVFDIDKKLTESKIYDEENLYEKQTAPAVYEKNDLIFRPSEAIEISGRGIYVPITESKDKISLEYVYVYPPGIPIIVPGEKISRQTAQLINRYKKLGFTLEGTVFKDRIEVLKHG